MITPVAVPLSWSTAVPDWKDRISTRGSLFPELPLHDAYAEKALTIFKGLRCPDLDGFPEYGAVCDDWVFELVRVIFGSYDPEVKKRYLREFFVMIPKKNGKTAIAAAIIVTACILNMSPEAQFILIAPSIELARGAFDHAAGIIKRTPRIRPLFAPPQESTRTIKNLNAKIPSKIMIKAADADIVTGLKNATVLIDETHVFANRPSAKGVFTEIRGALSHPKNRHFLLQITTQSKIAPHGVFKSEIQTARAVRDGTLARPMLPLLYELPEEIARKDGWKDEALWPLVNPHMGRSVDMDYLRDELRKAEEEGAESLALVASQHFNVQVGSGTHDDRWIGADYWAEATVKGLTLEELIARCEVCVAGIDGGGMDDLLGLTVVGRERKTRGWLTWSKAWVHKIALERRKSIAPMLEDLEAAGELVICKHPTQDVDELVSLVGSLHRAGVLPKKAGVGLDPEGVAAIVDALELDGIPTEMLVPVSQGYRLNGAIKGAERKLFDGSLRHADQELMRWCVGNAKTETRGNAVIVTKAVSGSGKIDPLMALFNGVWLMSLNPAATARMDDYFASLEAST